MERLAATIAAAEPRIDVLINNAGAMFNRRSVTADGLERTFALNHMAYFVLSNRLRDRLAAAAPARIVSVASAAHRGNTLDFGDLQSARSYRGFTVYGRSKLANILFTRELARRLAGTGVTANCLHPGFVATRFGDNSDGFIRVAIGVAKSSSRYRRRKAPRPSSISRARRRWPASAAAISPRAARRRRPRRRRTMRRQGGSGKRARSSRSCRSSLGRALTIGPRSGSTEGPLWVWGADDRAGRIEVCSAPIQALHAPAMTTRKQTYA